ncbi:ATP-binding cassette domain-containing protein [Paenibacillus dendritiformis]|uniref:ATP-binding cassette domain-containing protein n=1 Tax=Paenibacillus dendritiformis TaxID=130049 RepID=UPI00387E0AAD
MVANLVKHRGSQEILSGISFQARPGRVTGFLGPNGAGKRSTLRILLGLDRATSGSALINGKPFAKLTIGFHRPLNDLIHGVNRTFQLLVRPFHGA